MGVQGLASRIVRVDAKEVVKILVLEVVKDIADKK